jgi:HD-GYP domain-containing protein (c-di-GMP phosphodiesterase class II)
MPRQRKLLEKTKGICLKGRVLKEALLGKRPELLEEMRSAGSMRELLLLALKAKHPLQYKHSVEVAALAHGILGEMKRGAGRQGAANAVAAGTLSYAAMRDAALYHDIGKIKMSKGLVRKKHESLTRWRVKARKKHPEKGAKLVERILGGEAARAILQHHERLLGQGYPAELKGSEISLAAKIIAVADVFTSRVAPRSGGKPKSPRQALAELQSGQGKKYDPAVVGALEAFLIKKGLVEGGQ